MEAAIQTQNLTPALEGSKTLVTEDDRVIIKKLWLYAVPTAYEMSLIFRYLKDKDPLKVAFALMLVTAARPIEICRLNWNRFVYDQQNKQFMHLYHETYKASNRKSKIGRSIYYKQVKKDVSLKSQWLNELLHKYRQVCPGYNNNNLFPFSQNDSFNKFFSQLRKKVRKNKLPPEYDCFLEKCTEQIKGVATKTQYRISPYGLRRFAITFLYWSKEPIGFDQDIIALSRYVGHSNPKTTYEHYVLPKQAIGLNHDMINEHITIDQFIHLAGPCQSQLPDFEPKPEYQFIEPGQAVLNYWQT